MVMSLLNYNNPTVSDSTRKTKEEGWGGMRATGKPEYFLFQCAFGEYGPVLASLH